MLTGHLHIFFGEIPVKIFYPFFKLFLLLLLLLRCVNYLYILGIKPLLVIPFANIFSHPVGCLSLLSSVIYLFIFCFLSCAKACNIDYVPFVYF